MKDLSFCFGVMYHGFATKENLFLCGIHERQYFLPVVMNQFISQIMFRSSFSFL